MRETIGTASLLFMSVALLAGCNSEDKKAAPIVNNVMELNKEYVFTESTKITNTGTTELLVRKKHYWEENRTVVMLLEGTATID